MLVVVGNRITTPTPASVWYYSDSGQLVWTYNTGGNTYKCAIDNDGNVYVAGVAADNGDGNGVRNCWKLSSNGSYIVGLKIGDAAEAYDIVVDAAFVYAAVSTGAYRLDHNLGNQTLIKSSGANTTESIQVDVDGNIYFGIGGFSYDLYKYNALLQVQWAKGAAGNNKPLGIEILSNKDVIVVASTTYSIRYYKADGSSPDMGTWSYTFAGATRCAIDSSDNIYVVRSATGFYERLICLNTSGVRQWGIYTVSENLQDIVIGWSNTPFVCGAVGYKYTVWSADIVNKTLVSLWKVDTILYGLAGNGANPPLAFVGIDYKVNIGPHQSDQFGLDYNVNIGIDQRDAAADFYFTPTGFLIKFGAWRNESAMFKITRDDLYYDGSNPPVTISKRSPKDTINKVIVKGTDIYKDHGFIIGIASDKVDQDITNTVRKRVYDLLGLVSNEAVAKAAYRYLAESLYRYTSYKFSLAYRNMTLEAGDVGLLSDGFNIDRQLIRILSISEEADGKRLEIEAIEEKSHLYLLPGQNYVSNIHDRYFYPMPVAPNVYFTESKTEPVVHLHICPQDSNFNGFIIYYSHDNETYTYAGRCNSNSLDCNIDGTTLSTLPEATAVVYRPSESVDVHQNTTFLPIQPANDFQFFNNLSLIRVGEEAIAFKNVSSIGPDYRLGTLIRGLFNTSPVSHSAGSVWHTLKIDFDFRYNIEDIGKTIYFKVLPFYGTKMIQLEDATPVTHQIGGFTKPAPASLTRITEYPGFEVYSTADFDLSVNLAGKEQGFNIGGFDVALWGSYTRDPSVSSMELRVEKPNGDLLYLESESIDGSIVDEFTKTVTAAMRAGQDPVVVFLTPGAIVLADRRKISADQL